MFYYSDEGQFEIGSKEILSMTYHTLTQFPLAGGNWDLAFNTYVSYITQLPKSFYQLLKPSGDKIRRAPS